MLRHGTCRWSVYIATDGRTGDMASLPLDFLVNHGVVVDLAPQVSDWSAITPQMIEKSGAEIRDGDILILHTGWHKYYEGQSQQDLVRYFCYHPGPTLATLEWMLKKKIKWFGMDTGSCDHPMNTSIRTMRPDIAREVFRMVKESRQAVDSGKGTPMDSLRFGIENVRKSLELAIEMSLVQKFIFRKLSVDELFDDTTRVLA